MANAVIKHAGSTRTAGECSKIFNRRTDAEDKITVRVEFQTTPDGKYRVPPKTPRSRRALPLPEVVGKALATHIAEFPPTEDSGLLSVSSPTSLDGAWVVGMSSGV